MKHEKLNVSGIKKTLHYSLMLSLLGFSLVGCGEKDAHKGGTSTSAPSEEPAKAATGLALSLPANLPAQVDQVKVTLTEYQLAIGAPDANGGPCILGTIGHPSGCGILPPSTVSSPWTKTYTFSTKDKTIAISNLEPKTYNISVDLLAAATKKVYEHGAGTVRIEVGKTATANISLVNVSGDTGDLVIHLDQNNGDNIPGISGGSVTANGSGSATLLNNILPGAGSICNQVGFDQSCVQTGNSYSWKLIRPSGTKWCGEDLAKDSKIVDSKLCSKANTL